MVLLYRRDPRDKQIRTTVGVTNNVEDFLDLEGARCNF